MDPSPRPPPLEPIPGAGLPHRVHFPLEPWMSERHGLVDYAALNVVQQRGTCQTLPLDGRTRPTTLEFPSRQGQPYCRSTRAAVRKDDGDATGRRVVPPCDVAIFDIRTLEVTDQHSWAFPMHGLYIPPIDFAPCRLGLFGLGTFFTLRNILRSWLFLRERDSSYSAFDIASTMLSF